MIPSCTFGTTQGAPVQLARRYRTKLNLMLSIVGLVCGCCVPAHYWQDAEASERAGDPESTTVVPTSASPTTSAVVPDSAEPTRGPPGAAGELRLAVREDLKTLNPFLVTNASEKFVVSLLYDTLLGVDSDGNLIPNLAERWEAMPGSTDVTVWLDPNARWHNGRSVLAEDVVFTFDLIRRWQIPGLAPLAALVDRVEALSPREVKWSLIDSRSDALQLLTTTMVIVPAPEWSAVDDPLSYANLDGPIGSGPFRLVEFAREERVVLRNTLAHHSPPRVASVVIEVVRDQDRALGMLQHDELDAIGWSIEPEMARRVLGNPVEYAGILIAQSAGSDTQTLLWNLRRSPYGDVAFRQALAQAIDTEAIIEEVLLGLGDVAPAGLFVSSSQRHDPSIPSLAREAGRAASELDSMGFLDTDGDGWREMPDQSPLQVLLSCPELPTSVQVAEMVVQHLQQVGVGSDLVVVPQDAWVPTLMAADFDVALHSAAISDSREAFVHFHSSQGTLNGTRVSGQNFGGYSSPEFDELVLAALGEPQRTLQLDLSRQLQVLLANDMPQTALYSAQVLSLFRTGRFTGWRAQPGNGLLHRATIAGITPRQKD